MKVGYGSGILKLIIHQEILSMIEQFILCPPNVLKIKQEVEEEAAAGSVSLISLRIDQRSSEYRINRETQEFVASLPPMEPMVRQQRF